MYDLTPGGMVCLRVYRTDGTDVAVNCHWTQALERLTFAKGLANFRDFTIEEPIPNRASVLSLAGPEQQCLACGCLEGENDPECPGCDACHGIWSMRSVPVSIALTVARIAERGVYLLSVVGSAYVAVRVFQWLLKGAPLWGGR